ncbi:MAG: Histidine kinase, partial [Candidatus Hydrogenedentes bacterium]|nr:Histidine kinase [Candidatus Hydrogenedentota bacterium]
MSSLESEAARLTLTHRILWQLISVPIYVKVFGIGLLISLLFASIAFFLMRGGVLQAHYQVHGEMALSVALSLASRLESSDLAGKGDLDRVLDETMTAFPSVRYILVSGSQGEILSHGFTFPKEVPPDLMDRSGDLCATCHAGVLPLELSSDLLEVRSNVVLPKGSLRAYRRSGGLVLDVTV